MQTYQSYQQLARPRWSPPAKVFGPVWITLYILIALSFGNVFWMYGQHRIAFAVVVPFVLNLVFNFIFTTLQFKLKNNYLAALDILLVDATLIWAMMAIYPSASWIAYIQIPYLLWVLFATVLQLTITYMNR